MNLATRSILIIVGNSIFLSCGILMIIIPCILISNWWPLLSIFVFATSFIFPLFGGVFNENDYLFDNEGQHELGTMVACLATGILITIGYTIPIELFRLSSMQLIEMLLTIGGGTIILASLILFWVLVIKRGKNELGF